MIRVLKMDRTNEQKGSQVGERVARFRGRWPDGTADRPIFKFARYPFEKVECRPLSDHVPSPWEDATRAHETHNLLPLAPPPRPGIGRPIIRNWSGAKSDLRLSIFVSDERTTSRTTLNSSIYQLGECSLRRG